MSVSDTVAPPPSQNAVERNPPLHWPVAAAALVAFTLTTTLRMVGMGRAADVFVDELIYRDIGRSVVNGGFPRTEMGLFFLHPPGFFYLQATWENTFGVSPDAVAAVYNVRDLNALVSGGTAVLLLVLVTRSASLPAGMVAGALFALEPYCIRQNNRVMLETPTMFWVLAGYVVLLTLTQRPLPKHPHTRAMCSGLLFGLALLTKDHADFITLLPLLLAVILNWGPPRRLTLICAGTALVPYGLYVVVIAANGHLQEFWRDKTVGAARLFGFIQETGFNAVGTPPLTERLSDQISTFGSTYLLLTLAPFTLLVLLRSKDPRHRLLALFHGCAGLTLAYAVAIGTLEEQALYLLVVPNLMALSVALSLLLEDRRRPVIARTCAATFVTALLVLGSVAYLKDRLTPDDGYQRLRAYMAQHLPAGANVITVDGGESEGITWWALNDRYVVGRWITPEERAAAHVQYLVIPWKVIDQGYGAEPKPVIHALAAQGVPVFVVHGPSYGALTLYRLPLPQTPAAPPAPPVPRRSG
jgi:4-amino-4-deoxy-L-arabinose transferase-like glycosyltransferase